MLLSVHHIQDTPPGQSSQAQKVSSAGAEKPCSRLTQLVSSQLKSPQSSGWKQCDLRAAEMNFSRWLLANWGVLRWRPLCAGEQHSSALDHGKRPRSILQTSPGVLSRKEPSRGSQEETVLGC